MKLTVRGWLRSLLPHMITECTGCRQAAGFWVTDAPGNGTHYRRPWCLSCITRDDSPVPEDYYYERFTP